MFLKLPSAFLLLFIGFVTLCFDPLCPEAPPVAAESASKYPWETDGSLRKHGVFALPIVLTLSAHYLPTLGRTASMHTNVSACLSSTLSRLARLDAGAPLPFRLLRLLLLSSFRFRWHIDRQFRIKVCFILFFMIIRRLEAVMRAESLEAGGDRDWATEISQAPCASFLDTSRR